FPAASRENAAPAVPCTHTIDLSHGDSVQEGLTEGIPLAAERSHKGLPWASDFPSCRVCRLFPEALAAHTLAPELPLRPTMHRESSSAPKHAGYWNKLVGALVVGGLGASDRILSGQPCG